MRLRVHKLVRLKEDGYTAERIDDPPPELMGQAFPIPSGGIMWRKYQLLDQVRD
jgi:hypothetical protein